MIWQWNDKIDHGSVVSYDGEKDKKYIGIKNVCHRIFHAYVSVTFTVFFLYLFSTMMGKEKSAKIITLAQQETDQSKPWSGKPGYVLGINGWVRFVSKSICFCSNWNIIAAVKRSFLVLRCKDRLNIYSPKWYYYNK